MNFTEAVRLAKAGHEAGYQYLYYATYKSKFYLALQYMKNEEAAQDVIQDSYMKAFSRLDTLERPEAFPSWLGMIVANTARNALAKKNPLLFSEITPEDQEMDFEELIEDEKIENQPELSYTRQETQELVREMIDSLSEEQRLCILMFYIEGESIKDIATVLGCSENTVKSRLNYGRKNLKLKAEALQKKGYKLFGFGPVLLLLGLLRKQETVMAAEGEIARASAVSQEKIFRFVKRHISESSQGTAAGSAAKAAAPAGGSGLFSTAAGKIAVGKVAAAVIAAAAAGIGIGALTAKIQYDSRQELQDQAAVPETETQSEQVPETVVTPEAAEEPEKTEPEEDSLQRVRSMFYTAVQEADTCEYNGNAGTPSGNYRYALVMLSPEDSLPTLLLEQENTSYMYALNLCRYDQAEDTIKILKTEVQEGVSGGYYRSSLGLAGDGNGLQFTEISGGTGDTAVSRCTLNSDTLSEEQLWTGRMDQIPEEFQASEIRWYDWKDLSGLQNWGVSAGTSAGGTDASAGTREDSSEEQALPADGSRIVFTGTVDSYSYEEVVALQGVPDPNASGANQDSTYRLIILDQPREMELLGTDEYRNGEVFLINVTDAAELAQYEGQHLTFSIDPSTCRWPSDTSLPVGQPSTADVHVLN